MYEVQLYSLIQKLLITHFNHTNVKTHFGIGIENFQSVLKWNFLLFLQLRLTGHKRQDK